MAKRGRLRPPDRPAGYVSSSFRVGTLLALGSGCAALAHELLWTRRLIDLLGASAESSTRVFGCFFLGLALGAASTPRLLRRVRRPWRAAAIAEGGVALFAVPALFLPQWTDWIWPLLGSGGLLNWQGSLIKLVLSALTVFPAAFCMGLFLPCLARSVLTDRLDLARHGVWLYAANTLGGVLGVAGVSAVTLHAFGAVGSMQLAILINLLIAMGCLWLDRGTAGTKRSMTMDHQFESQSLPVPRPVWRAALLLSFMSGVGILSFEVLALQLVSLVAPLSFYGPMAVLLVVVLLLGLGAMWVPYLLRRVGALRRLLGVILLATAMLMVTTPLWFLFCSHLFPLEPQATLTRFLAVLIVFSIGTLGPAFFSAGLLFPCLSAWSSEEGNDRHGRYWGALLAANGLGGIGGAELTYRLLIPSVGIHCGMGVVGLAYALAALVWAWLFCGASAGRQRAVSIVVSLTALLLTAGLLSRLPHTDDEGVAIVDERVGREGTVAVVYSPQLGLRIMTSNQYVLGGTTLRYDQARMAHVPLVMHPDPRSVAFIGLATGITAGAALEHQVVQSLTAVELSPLVIRAADLHFRAFNHEVTRDRRVEIVREDGRTFLQATPERFDVVVGDFFLPWAPGEARLYSLEHFRGVRDALRPGGMFCQWLAIYQLTPEHFQTIRDTFCEVFGEALLFRNTFDARYPGLALVGFREGELDWSIVQKRCAALRHSNQVRDPLMRHAEGLGMLFLGSTTAAADEDTRLNTLANMRLELAAGRGRLTGEPNRKYVHGEQWLDFAYQLGLRKMPPTQEPLNELAWLGQYLTLWNIARQNAEQLTAADLAQVPQLQRTIDLEFPESVRNDDEADWAQWPGDTSVIKIPAVVP